MIELSQVMLISGRVPLPGLVIYTELMHSVGTAKSISYNSAWFQKLVYKGYLLAVWMAKTITVIEEKICFQKLC